MSRLGFETRVGLFVVTALAVLIAFVLVLGHVRLTPGFKLHCDFAYAGSLQVGAPVKVSGIQIGHVADLRLLTGQSTPPAAAQVLQAGQQAPPRVRAHLTLDPQVAPILTGATTFAVASQGVIGEAYLELVPSSAGDRLGEGAAVRGMDAPRLYVMALQAASLLDALGNLLQESPRATSPDSPVGRALVGLLGNLNSIISQRHDALVEMIGNFAAASGDLRALLVSLRAGVRDGAALARLLDNSDATFASLRRELPPLIEHGQRALGSVDRLGAKAEESFDAAALAHLLADARNAARNIEQLTHDGQTLVSSLRRGEGSAGGFLQDPQLYDDLKELLRDLKRHPWKIFWRD